MNKHYLVTVVLGVGFCLLLFAPPRTVAGLLGLKWESKIWARLVGILGFVWILLGFARNELAGLVRPTPTGDSILLVARCLCGGIIIGLLLAIVTKHRENP